MFELTDRTLKESRKQSVEPQIVLEIEGVETVFGAVEILKYIQIGDPGLFIDGTWVIGGLNSVTDQEDVISFDGTGTTINQSLKPDQGQVSSVSSIAIALLDPNNIITQVISPGVIVPDILGRRAKLYMGFANTAFKDDYIVIFHGIIDDIQAAAGKVTLNLAHPDQKRRQTLFIKAEGDVIFDVSPTDTTIQIAFADTKFRTPYVGPEGIDTSLKYYAQIDDEIVSYTGVTSGSITGVVRSALDTDNVSHDAGAKASTFYVLEGDMVTLALKLMLSGVNGYYREGIALTHIEYINGELTIENSIFFDNVNVQELYGLVEGDYVTITGALDVANNVTMATIAAVVIQDNGSYIVLNGVDLVIEANTPATVSFRSQYDTLGIGMAMTPEDVDVEEHHYWRNLFLSQFEYRFYIKDQINGNDFIQKELYTPYGAYSIPRKGRCSLGFHLGPVPRNDLPIFSQDNLREPSKVILKRNIQRNFYNTVVYSYDQAAIEDKFLTGDVFTDATSRTRIPLGNKVLSFKGTGIRTDLSAAANTKFAAERFLSRYRFAAEYFEGIKIFYKDSFNAEPGDLVLMDFENLKVSNTLAGDRDKPQKIFEVTNKKMDVRKGDVSFELTDTNFDLSERFCVIGPASIIESGTDEYAIIQDSYGSLFPGNEPKKWEKYLGLPVLIHDENFTFQEEVILLRFDAADRYKAIFKFPMSEPVQAGWIMDLPTYADSPDPRVNRRYKLFHGHWSADVEIVSGVSSTVFTVDAGDIDKFQVGFPVRIHNDDFTIYSEEVYVAAVDTGLNQVTVDRDLGFTPAALQIAAFLGFPDGDHCYRWV